VERSKTTPTSNPLRRKTYLNEKKILKKKMTWVRTVTLQKKRTPPRRCRSNHGNRNPAQMLFRLWENAGDVFTPAAHTEGGKNRTDWPTPAASKTITQKKGAKANFNDRKKTFTKDRAKALLRRNSSPRGSWI